CGWAVGLPLHGPRYSSCSASVCAPEPDTLRVCACSTRSGCPSPCCFSPLSRPAPSGSTGGMAARAGKVGGYQSPKVDIMAANNVPHTIVIGAGIGGLSAAISLAARGHAVTIVEQNATTGGKMGELSLDGFRWDTGPTVLTMRHVFESLFA